ncbi:hypothetical protein MKL09_01945 [Methylobacterium sp. J-048]|uniref:hypothetical protein n=1 Tax=Methylobacterium sp. J-048 TaxID=2836635 RepID=UPI001FBB6DBD|nr:hypothetical protein [Methylobacterium sp. J-048]MCJ2055311.1 hypothetical protein [Methylobacterium sp. J-048]
MRSLQASDRTPNQVLPAITAAPHQRIAALQYMQVRYIMLPHNVPTVLLKNSLADDQKNCVVSPPMTGGRGTRRAHPWRHARVA